MPGPTTYRDIVFVTVIAGLTGGVTIPRGSRVSLSTDGANIVYIAGATVRGDYIVEADTPPGVPVPAAAIGKGGDFYGVVNTGITVNINDTLYAAANGTVSNVQATGAPIVGVAREAGVAGGLVGILLKAVL